jgi:hypothetical protein
MIIDHQKSSIGIIESVCKNGGGNVDKNKQNKTKCGNRPK